MIFICFPKNVRHASEPLKLHCISWRQVQVYFLSLKVVSGIWKMGIGCCCAYYFSYLEREYIVNIGVYIVI